MELCRRKKPAWASTEPVHDEVDTSDEQLVQEGSAGTSSPAHTTHGNITDSSSASVAEGPNSAENSAHDSHGMEQGIGPNGADSAAFAAVATAVSHRPGKQSSRGTSDSHAAHAKADAGSTHHQGPNPQQESAAKGNIASSPAERSSLTGSPAGKGTSTSNSTGTRHNAAAHSKPAPSQTTFEDMLQRFQEPTLGSILRDSTIAGESARKVAEKAARAADDALPPFLTASSSPQSTSRLHVDSKSNRSRPGSADSTSGISKYKSEPHAEPGMSDSCCRTSKQACS